MIELYKDYRIAIGTNNCITSPVKVEKGVIQGDCLSPLLFNMCFNTWIKCIDRKEIKLIGYSCCNTSQPRHWFQFADDTAVTSAIVEDSQVLLNVFTKWCHWAEFKVRFDKCLTFAIKKSGKTAT